MGELPDDADLQAYYARDLERDRLASGLGRVEFLRTIEIVGRSLPDPPAVVADVGGGPGRYVDWLIGAGYQVALRDVVADHVEQVRDRHGRSVDAAVGDARELDLADASVDAVLLLGPLYHLPDADDRRRAIDEAVRVLRPGGVLYAAAICRWAPRVHGMLVERVHVEYPEVLAAIDEMERSGWMPPVQPGGFTGYAHRPEDLRAELVGAGLTVESLVSVESVAVGLGDLGDRLTDPDESALLFDTLRTLEAVPELLGVGPHLLATARPAG